MDPQVYAVIKKIHKILSEKEEATLTNQELSYVTGLLESVLTLCAEDGLQVVDGVTLPHKKSGSFIGRIMGD